MPNNIIRNHNDPNYAITLSGIRVERQKEIFLRSYKQWFPVLPTSLHFCFTDYSQPRGTTLFCTCGSPAIIVNYSTYQKFSSYMGNEVIACHFLMERNMHSDGSHE